MANSVHSDTPREEIGMIEDEGEQLTMDTHIKKISIRRLRCQMAHVRVANTTAFDQVIMGEYPHAKKKSRRKDSNEGTYSPPR